MPHKAAILGRCGHYRRVIGIRHRERTAVRTHYVDALAKQAHILLPEGFAVGQVHEDAASGRFGLNLVGEARVAVALRQAGYAKHASAAGGNLGSALLQQLHERLSNGSVARNIQVDHALRRIFEELPVDGAERRILHGTLHARVHVQPVGRAAGGADSRFTQAPLHPFGRGLSVGRTLAHQGEQRFARGLVVHARHSRPSGSGLAAHYGARVLRVEGVEDAYGDAGVHGRLYAGGIEHLGAGRGHVQRSPVRHLRHGVRLRYVLRVGRHDAGDVRPDLKVVGLQCGGEDAGAEVAASAAQGSALAFVGAGDEARRHEHLHVGVQRHGGGYIIIG